MPASPQTATAKFEMPTWDEKPIVEYDDGRKLTHAKVTKKFTGDLIGESVLEYLMVYPPEPPVPYVGVERFVGTFLGKRGSFALTITGTYDGRAREKAMIIAGSGTGELATSVAAGASAPGTRTRWRGSRWSIGGPERR